MTNRQLLVREQARLQETLQQWVPWFFLSFRPFLWEWWRFWWELWWLCRLCVTLAFWTFQSPPISEVC